jgi:hypothetical protein
MVVDRGGAEDDIVCLGTEKNHQVSDSKGGTGSIPCKMKLWSSSTLHKAHAGRFFI